MFCVDIYFIMVLGSDFMSTKEINVLVLAYLGDTVYENYVRRHLINLGIGNVNDLQREAISFVSASSQAKFVTKMLEEDFLTAEEMDVFKRARNYVNITIQKTYKRKEVMIYAEFSNRDFTRSQENRYFLESGNNR